MSVIEKYFRASYDEYGPAIAFAPAGWMGKTYPINGVVFSDAKSGGFFFYTDVNKVHYDVMINPPFKPANDEVYGFKIEWDDVNGIVKLWINGILRSTLPAPKVDPSILPIQILGDTSRIYDTWWDVPEHKNASLVDIITISTGLLLTGSYFLK